MPIQVAHVVPLAARIGGYERQALLLAGAQGAAGPTASLITHASHARRLRHRTGSLTLHGVAWTLGRASASAIDPAISSAQVLHVHAVDPFSAAVVARGRRRGVPAILKIATQGDAQRYADPHAFPPEVAAVRRLEPWRLRRQQRLMAKAWSVLRDCERFIALSSAIEEELLGVGIARERIERLPNAVVVPASPVEIRRHAERAIYVGRLEGRKRLGDLLDAFSIVRAAHADAQLHLVGDGADLAELQRRSPEARFHGSIDDPQPCLAQADVFVFPSEREGCPNALLEAAAAGIPCIATAIPGVTDWFDATMMRLVEPARPDLIAAAWLELWSDAARRRALAQAARSRVERVADIRIILEHYQQIYLQLASDAAEV